MPIPGALIADDIRNALDYSDYLKIVAKHDKRVAAEAAEPSAPKTKAAKVTKPKTTKQPTPKASKPKITSSQPPKPKPTSTKPSKAVLKKKRKLVKETPDEPSPAKRTKGGLVGKRRKPKSPIKLVDEFANKVFLLQNLGLMMRKLTSNEVQGKGKEKIINEHVAHTLLGLNTSKKKSAADHELESDEIVTPINKEKDKSNMELTEINLEFKIKAMLDQTLFFMEKPQEEEPKKTNAELEVQSMVTVPIHQNTSFVPPMTTLVLQNHEDHKNLYEALEKSMDCDHLDQIQANLAEACKKHRKRLDSPRTPIGSPPPPLPPPPPSPGAYGAPGASRASTLPQLPPPPPLSSSKPADFDKSKQQKNDSRASDSTQPPISTHQLSDWTISDTRDKPSGSSVHHLSPPEDQQMNNDPVPTDEEHTFATPEPAWVIPTSHIPDALNNWANALACTYQAPVENSLLDKTGDMQTFMNWYCQKVERPSLLKRILKAKLMKSLKFSTQTSFIFSSRWKSVTRCLQIRLTRLIWKRFYIERHTIDSRHKDVRTYTRILSVVSIKAYSHYGYDYLKEIILRIADYQEYIILETDFKNLYPSDFEDLNLLLLQVIRQWVGDLQLGIESYQKQLNLTKLGWDARGFEYKHDYIVIESPCAVVFPISNNERKIMRFNEIYKFSDGTLTNILKALDYRVKEYKVNWLNPGMNTWF
nr:hypothetical protein [Tanacetum cinerariifolium]